MDKKRHLFWPKQQNCCPPKAKPVAYGFKFCFVQTQIFFITYFIIDMAVTILISNNFTNLHSTYLIYTPQNILRFPPNPKWNRVLIEPV